MLLRTWLLGFTLAALPACGYSVLTHEAIIDSAWDASIRPVLLKRFPAATPGDLVNAHAYAYGGAIVQDMGYYPFGSHFFSDLTHYVRSGDFVRNLIAEAKDLNEFAFALGALAHLAADNEGHSVAVNKVVPMLYPKIRQKFGPIATYADDAASHLKTEFAFDVRQVARGRYAPDAYRNFIGFEVSKDLLGRAFEKTYGLEFKAQFLNVDLAIGTYRRFVSSVIPEMTKVAWKTQEKQLVDATPGLTRSRFTYNLSRASYEKQWGAAYTKPGLWARFLGVMFKVLPKKGPFRALAFHPLTPPAETLFERSFNATLARARGWLANTGAQAPPLVNNNLDTGKPIHAGDYRLADACYAKLVGKLADAKYATVDPLLRENILAFYGAQPAPADKQNNKLATELQELRILGKEKANSTQ